jgi:hypothetical protein
MIFDFTEIQAKLESQKQNFQTKKDGCCDEINCCVDIQCSFDHIIDEYINEIVTLKANYDMEITKLNMLLTKIENLKLQSEDDKNKLSTFYNYQKYDEYRYKCLIINNYDSMIKDNDIINILNDNITPQPIKNIIGNKIMSKYMLCVTLINL